MTSKKKFGILAGLLCLWMCCGCLGLPVVGEPIIILFGWVPFLKRTVPEMYIEPTAVAVGLAALVGFAAALHSMAKWLYGHKQTEDAPPRPWRARWTLAITGIVFCVFAAGIATLVIVHEVGWLATSKRPIYRSLVVERFRSLDKLKKLSDAVVAYRDAHETFPPGGTFTQDGKGLQSWETAILPHLEVTPAKPPRTELPWDNAANAEFYRRELSPFFNPTAYDAPVRQDGFGLSHYAANVQVMSRNRGLRRNDIKDGAAHTIILGEVNAGFRPWGDPSNFRDPAKGFGDMPEQFGSPLPHVVNMAFGDGSVRSLPKDIDPAVLKAFATPAGGERVPEEWSE